MPATCYVCLRSHLHWHCIARNSSSTGWITRLCCILCILSLWHSLRWHTNGTWPCRQHQLWLIWRKMHVRSFKLLKKIHFSPTIHIYCQTLIRIWFTADNDPIYLSLLFSHCQYLSNTNTIHCHINSPAITITHSDPELFLIICESHVVIYNIDAPMFLSQCCMVCAHWSISSVI